MTMLHKILFVVLIAMMVLDGYTTIRVLAIGGRESNTWLAVQFARRGVLFTLLWTKALALALVFGLLWLNWRWGYPWGATVLLVASNALMTVLLVSNYKAYRRQKALNGG